MDTNDTTALLWDWLFNIRVPYLQSLGIDELRRTGVVVTGIREIDRDVQNQWKLTAVNIAKMIAFYKEGIPIRICKEQDVITIYEYVTRHILAWRARLHNSINIGSSPIEDLIVLDGFAAMVFDQAKYNYKPEIAQSAMTAQMRKSVSLNATNFFVPEKLPDKYKEPTEQKTDELPERESLADFFKSRVHLINHNKIL